METEEINKLKDKKNIIKKKINESNEPKYDEIIEEKLQIYSRGDYKDNDRQISILDELNDKIRQIKDENRQNNLKV